MVRLLPEFKLQPLRLEVCLLQGNNLKSQTTMGNNTIQISSDQTSTDTTQLQQASLNFLESRSQAIFKDKEEEFWRDHLFRLRLISTKSNHQTTNLKDTRRNRDTIATKLHTRSMSQVRWAHRSHLWWKIPEISRVQDLILRETPTKLSLLLTTLSCTSTAVEKEPTILEASRTRVKWGILCQARLPMELLMVLDMLEDSVEWMSDRMETSWGQWITQILQDWMIWFPDTIRLNSNLFSKSILNQSHTK